MRDSCWLAKAVQLDHQRIGTLEEDDMSGFLAGRRRKRRELRARIDISIADPCLSSELSQTTSRGTHGRILELQRISLHFFRREAIHCRPPAVNGWDTATICIEGAESQKTLLPPRGLPYDKESPRRFSRSSPRLIESSTASIPSFCCL